jgi:hypothetical protein
MELQNLSRELRRHVNLAAVACRNDGNCFPVLLTDVSPDGCQFRSDEAFEAGDRITVKHELLGDRAAEVRWACAGRVGMLFLERG